MPPGGPPVARGGGLGRVRPKRVVQGDTLDPDALKRKESEAHFQRAVLELAHLQHWVQLVLPRYTLDCGSCGEPVHWGRSIPPGWPDVVLFRPPRILAWELKAEAGVVTSEQADWLLWLEACGVEARVVRPSDWDYVVAALA